MRRTRSEPRASVLHEQEHGDPFDEDVELEIDPSAGPPLPELFLKDTRIKRRCPRCGAPLRRRHRTALIRLASLAYPVKRYACTDEACGWLGVLPSRHELAQRRDNGLKHFLSLLAAGTIALVILAAAGLLLMALWSFLAR